MPESQSQIRNLEGEHHGRKSLPEFTPQNVLVVVLVLVLILAGVYIFKPTWLKGMPGQAKPAAKQDQKQEAKGSGYSAVFLTNDQIYFGKLEEANSQYPRLREVYYLRVNQPLQPAPATKSAQPDVQLVKLGNELHGPVDEIKFNRDQILYIEDLKTDSRVVKAIEEFKGRK